MNRVPERQRGAAPELLPRTLALVACAALVGLWLLTDVRRTWANVAGTGRVSGRESVSLCALFGVGVALLFLPGMFLLARLVLARHEQPLLPNGRDCGTT